MNRAAMSGGPPSLTIGIEEEYQSIDPETRNLRSHIGAEIVAKGKTLLGEIVKPELHQSVVEIGTGICNNIKEAKREISSTSAVRSSPSPARTTAACSRRHPSLRACGATRRSIPTTVIKPSSKT